MEGFPNLLSTGNLTTSAIPLALTGQGVVQVCSWTLTASGLDMYNAKVIIVGPAGVGKVHLTAGHAIVCTEIRPPDDSERLNESES